MIRNKGIFALEELNEPTPEELRMEEEARATPEALADAQVDKSIAEAQTEQAEIDSIGAQIDEAEEIRDTVDGLADKVEERIETDERLPKDDTSAVPEEDRGISDETAQAVEIAVEHFRNRLGFKKKVMPALEAFQAKGKRKQTSMEALANLRDLSARTDAVIGIAQEGLWARIKNAWDRATTSSDEISTKIKKLATKKAIEEKTIVDPAWGRVFARSGSKELNAGDVEKYLALVIDRRKKLIPIVKKFTDIAKKASVEVDKGRFIGSDEGAKALLELVKDAGALEADYDKSFHENTGSESSVNIKSASTAEVKKISSLVDQLASDSEYERTLENFYNDVNEADMEVQINAAIRLGRGLANDIRAYRKLARSGLQKVYSGISDITMIEYKAVHSAYKYVAASVE